METQVFTEHFDLENTHWWFQSKRTMVLSLLRRYGALQGPGLDVGCGAGGTLEVLAQQGSWVGVDADPTALGFSRRREAREAAAPRRCRSARAPSPRASASTSSTTGASGRRAPRSGSAIGCCAQAGSSS